MTSTQDIVDCVQSWGRVTRLDVVCVVVLPPSYASAACFAADEPYSVSADRLTLI